MVFLKRIALIIVYFSVIFLVFGLINLLDSLEDFERYHCEGGGFSVLLPGEPKQSTNELNLLFGKFSFTTLTAGPQEAEFAVIYFDLPKDLKPRRRYAGLEEVSPLDYMKFFTLTLTGGRIVKEADLDFNGYPAKDFEIRVLGRVIIKARAILINNRYYHLMVTSHLPDVLNKKALEFFDSFAVDDTG